MIFSPNFLNFHAKFNTTMKGRLWDYIQQNKLFSPENKILLAVSSGIDSMVMLELFHELRIRCGIAHCNFMLRDTESDQDEQFVQNIAKEYDIPFHSKSFDTLEYAEKNKISIQMAARDLRYQWFEEIRKKNGYDCIATAHNKNDLAETILLNLIRGTGLRGLGGIKPRNGFLIRPVLFLSREEIKDYAREKNIKYREDSSNSSTKYKRNFVRHKVLPLLTELNPSLLNTMAEEAKHIQEINSFYESKINLLLETVINSQNESSTINIKALQESGASKLILFEFLKDYGFSASTIEDINNSLESSPGLQFFSDSHRVLKDRETLIITQNKPHDQNTTSKYLIEKDCNEIFIPLKLRLKFIENISDYKIPHDKDVAALDATSIKFPLELRQWKPGDYFHPLGMTGRKKLSDYFTDLKFSLIDKENVWLLCSGEVIVWIIGHRIDDTFKITQSTKRVLEVHFS
jgi:tRNA(Ile)-lysidine synthase